MTKLSERIDDFLQTSEQEYKKVVRDGKVIRKLVCPPGKKAQDGRCVVMTSKEKHTRKKAAKVAARKSKAKKSQANRKRSVSNRRRKSLG